MKIAELKTRKLGRCPWWMVLVLGVIVVLIAGVLFFVLAGSGDGSEELGQAPDVEQITEGVDEIEENPDEMGETNDIEEPDEEDEPTEVAEPPVVGANEPQSPPVAPEGNCTMSFGNLMLINPNFTVNEGFIGARRGQLISVSQNYGIPEYRYAGNGDNLMTPEAAAHLSEMVQAYQAAYPGHEMGTRSCFREKGTTCGRLCAATGTSDHHTGLTCDLIDQAYGSDLSTDDYANHPEWQWLRENSYKYGFIDRFPEAWAGGPMSQPANVDANGTTGLFETWHYRYVGVTAATEIATGKYNGGNYDSLEHYLKVTGRVADLANGRCE